MAGKNVEPDAKGYRKFGMRDKIAYAAGDLGCNMSFALKGTVQTFWLVYMMLETGLLSILLLVVTVWDAVNDPLIGSMIDRDTRRYKRGKFKQYIFWGSWGLLIGGAAVFLPFPNAHVGIKCAMFVLGYIVWDAFYTMVNIPYGSMLPLISEDPAERAELSTWRAVGSLMGSILPKTLLPFLIWNKVNYDGSDAFLSKIEIPQNVSKEQFLTNPTTGKAYEIGEAILHPQTGQQVEILLGERVFWVAIIMGIIGFIVLQLMLRNVIIRVEENRAKVSQHTEKINIFRSFGNFMKNRPAVGATLAAVGMFLGINSVDTASTIMFAAYFNMAQLSGVMQLLGFLPMLLFIPFITKIVNKHGKKEASAAGTLVSLAGSAVLLVFPLMPNISAALAVYLLGLVIFGLGLGIYTCVSWALIADAIDYHEWKFGTREEGTVYALHSFFRKLAQAAGPIIILWLMGVLGYVSRLGIMGQTDTTKRNICWLVAGLYCLSAVLQFIGIALVYNIDRKSLEQMRQELDQRKKR